MDIKELLTKIPSFPDNDQELFRLKSMLFLELKRKSILYKVVELSLHLETCFKEHEINSLITAIGVSRWILQAVNSFLFTSNFLSENSFGMLYCKGYTILVVSL